eukprot:306204-Chlamydomonas_euryale.AAC.1
METSFKSSYVGGEGSFQGSGRDQMPAECGRKNAFAYSPAVPARSALSLSAPSLPPPVFHTVKPSPAM